MISAPKGFFLMATSRFVEVADEEINRFKSRCRTISTISNQFRKIEFWLIPPKEPFDITISRNDTKKSPSALHLQTFRRVRIFAKKHNFIH